MNQKVILVYGDIVFSGHHKVKSFLGHRTVLQNTIHHQSAFYNKSLFHSFRYNSNLKIISDYELNLLIYLKGLPSFYAPITIAICNINGASSELYLSLHETNLIRAANIKSSFKNFIYSKLLVLYYFQKILRLHVQRKKYCIF